MLVFAFIIAVITTVLLPRADNQIIFADGSEIKQKVITDTNNLSSYYLSNQVQDQLAINYGSFTGTPSYDIDSPYMEMYSEAPLAVLAYAWNCPESTYYQDNAVLESIRLGLLSLCNVQCWTGGFPTGKELEIDKKIQPSGVQLQDYGDTPHQFFLGDCALYAYSIVRSHLPEDAQRKIDTMLERLFEFSVIRSVNYSTRSLTFEGFEYPQDYYYKEQVKIPKSVLESAARVDITLRIEKIGNPVPVTWRAYIGDKTLELDTKRINPNGINPYRQYEGWLPISVAVWQIDDVSEILPYGIPDSDDYLFNITFEKMSCWDRNNTYAIVRSRSNTEPTWISIDNGTWQPWDKDLALQVWVYGSNTELVGGEIFASNQEAGRFYLIHKSRWLFDITKNTLLYNLANEAFEKEVSIFARITKDGVFPESNQVIVNAAGDPGIRDQVFYGGWSPGHGFISMYLIGLVAKESQNPTLISLVRDSSEILEYLIYKDDEGYKVMNATTTRDNDEVILTNRSGNLFALGFIALTSAPALKSILAEYVSLNPVNYPDISYPLCIHQIDSMPIVSIYENLEDNFIIRKLPAEGGKRFIKNFPDAKLLAIKTRDYLYYISYGNATPSGGCIANKFNLITRQHEVLATGASLNYGQPLFELKNPDGSSSIWDTQADIEILRDEYPFEISFSGYLRHANQVPTDPYEIEYIFLDDGVVGTKEILTNDSQT